MGHLWLIMDEAFITLWVGHFPLNVWSIDGLNGWGSYSKVNSCFVWKYAQKMLVLRGVPFPVIAQPQVLVPLNSPAVNSQEAPMAMCRAFVSKGIQPLCG